MLETEMKKLTAAIEALTQAIAPLTIDAAPVEEPVTEKPEVAIGVPPTSRLPRLPDTSVLAERIERDVILRKCLDLSRAGYKAAIKEKLNSLNVNRVSELASNSTDYKTFCDWISKQVGEPQ